MYSSWRSPSFDAKHSRQLTIHFQNHVLELLISLYEYFIYRSINFIVNRFADRLVTSVISICVRLQQNVCVKTSLNTLLVTINMIKTTATTIMTILISLLHRPLKFFTPSWALVSKYNTNSFPSFYYQGEKTLQTPFY